MGAHIFGATRRLRLRPGRGRRGGGGAALDDAADTVVAGCLRNATAVGRWLAGQDHGTEQRPDGVIASGERRPDGCPRPALEDLLGADVAIAALKEHRGGPLSPEAAMAPAAFGGCHDRLAPGHRHRHHRVRPALGTGDLPRPRGAAARPGLYGIPLGPA